MLTVATMQVVIGTNPAPFTLCVPIWVALSWLAIVLTYSDFASRYYWSGILYLAWLAKADLDQHIIDMLPENVIRRTVLEFKPCFDGKETEQNWVLREKNIKKLRQMISELTPETEPNFLKTIREMLDDLLKTVNSLRTTVSSNGCLFFQDLAKECGLGMDNMIDILLPNFIKLSANTKPIARANANETILAIVTHCHYRLSIVQQIHSACKDKNVQPRRFACDWLKKVIRDHTSDTIDRHGGLDLIEASVKLGLEDRDKDVREAMRRTYWNFARRWPQRSEALFSGLDKTKQDQLIADPSNPNPPALSTPSKADSTSTISRSTGPAAAKTSMKNVRKSKFVEDLNVAGPSTRNEATATKSVTISSAMIPKDDTTSAAPASKINTVSAATIPKADTTSTAQPPKIDTTSAAPAPKVDMASAARAPKPSLKEVKARLTAQKKADGQTENPHFDVEIAPTGSQGPKADTHPTAPLPKSSFMEKTAPLPVSKSKQISAEQASDTVDNAQDAESIPKTGAISAAPARRRKARYPRRKSRSPGKGKPEDTQTTTDMTQPEDTTEQEVATDAAQVDAPVTQTVVVPTNDDTATLPKTTLFLDHALTRVSQRSLDQHGFRKLQVHLRDDSQNAKYEVLVEPLCSWIATPTSTVSSTEWQDVQAQALATLRLLLINPLWASKHYSIILTSLLAANEFYLAQGPMVVGIKKNLTFIVNHCELLACLRSVSDLMQMPHYETMEEIGLLTLGAMLHKIHEDDSQEPIFYQRLVDEQALIQRLGTIGSCGLHSKEISVRKAAISFAQEFWHTVPKEDYFKVIAKDNVQTQDLLQYYIARHLKLNDHLESL